MALFLLDMGLMTAKSLTQFKGHSAWLLCWSLGAPAVHAAMACGLALVAGLGIAQAPISSSALSRIVELLLNMLDI
jgi:hypothetical protein